MIAESSIGGLDVLNCNLGDLKLSFDPANPVQMDRAKRAVRDMLRRGYVIFVEVDGKLHRVKQFDESKCEYIITDAPGVESDDDDNESTLQEQGEAATESSQEELPEREASSKSAGKKGGKGKSTKRVPAAGAKATSIAPRAGG